MDRTWMSKKLYKHPDPENAELRGLNTEEEEAEEYYGHLRCVYTYKRRLYTMQSGGIMVSVPQTWAAKMHYLEQQSEN